VIVRARDLWSPRNRNTVSTDKSSPGNGNTVDNDKSFLGKGITVSNTDGKDDNKDDDNIINKNIKNIDDNTKTNNNDNHDGNDNVNKNRIPVSVTGKKYTFDYVHESILNENITNVRTNDKDVSTESQNVCTNNENGSTDYNCMYEGVSTNPVCTDEKNGSGGDTVVVDDTDADVWIPSLWLPGRILHIYSHRGIYISYCILHLIFDHMYVIFLEVMMSFNHFCCLIFVRMDTVFMVTWSNSSYFFT
jgi:hypothetical protein